MCVYDYSSTAHGQHAYRQCKISVGDQRVDNRQKSGQGIANHETELLEMLLAQRAEAAVPNEHTMQIGQTALESLQYLPVEY
jgi:hypothetical protein